MDRPRDKSVRAVLQRYRTPAAMVAALVSSVTTTAAVNYGLSPGPDLAIASGVLAGSAIGTLTYASLSRRQERPVVDNTVHIPQGATHMLSGRFARQIPQGVPDSLMVVGVGGYGGHQSGRLLHGLYGCGLDPFVGSALIIENNVQEINTFMNSIPAVYHDRIEYASSAAFAGGMANRPSTWTLDYADLCGSATEEAASRAVRRHLSRNDGRSPSTVLCFISQGGQAALGLIALEEILQQFGHSLVIGFTALPRPERLRDRVGELKREFERRGVFGWMYSDNLCPDPIAADWGMVCAIIGLCDASLHADQPTALNNAFSLALPEKPGGVLIYQTVTGSVAAYPLQPDPSGPQFYVYEQTVAEQLLLELRKIEQGMGLWSAAVPVGRAGTSTFDVAMCSLFPSALYEVADYVTRGRRRRARVSPLFAGDQTRKDSGMLFGQANYETIFASVATAVDPEHPICPVMVVRLAAAQGGDRIVEQIGMPVGGNPSPGSALLAEGARDVRIAPLDELFFASTERFLRSG